MLYVLGFIGIWIALVIISRIQRAWASGDRRTAVILGAFLVAAAFLGARWILTRPPPDATYDTILTADNKDFVLEHNKWSKSVWQSDNTDYLRKAIIHEGNAAYGKRLGDLMDDEKHRQAEAERLQEGHQAKMLQQAAERQAALQTPEPVFHLYEYSNPSQDPLVYSDVSFICEALIAGINEGLGQDANPPPEERVSPGTRVNLVERGDSPCGPSDASIQWNHLKVVDSRSPLNGQDVYAGSWVRLTH